MNGTGIDEGEAVNIIMITPSLQKTTKRGNGGSRCNSKGTCSEFKEPIECSGNFSNHDNQTVDINQNVDSANKHDSKRQKMDWDLIPFSKLNPQDNDVHAQRVQSRYKMILKGKNTVGYDHYIRTVPKQQRRIRSMDTPNTPDHTLDIPAKRWNGLVKAWYVTHA
jgi:Histone RNA hairpin-binding protein RNA-binding domain